MLSPRVTPHMIGLGLLELIPPDTLLAIADPQDTDHDGISGRPNWRWDLTAQALALGRFGWKAINPTVNQQSQGAFNGDIGISTPLEPQPSGDCTPQQTACLAAPNGNSAAFENLEAHSDVTSVVAFYAQNLAVPARRNADDPDVLAGRTLFYKTGCHRCHTPSHVTGPAPTAASDHLAHQTIWPYTDLLLHDMGEGLADHRPEGMASGSEWRTAPLWGIGLIPIVNGHSYYLHDGRARNLLEAILWHGGEAAAQQARVVKMSPQERKQLIRFVESL